MVRALLPLLVLMSCATIQKRTSSDRVSQLSALAQQQNLQMPALLQVDDVTKTSVAVLAGPGLLPVERLRLLNRFLRSDRGRHLTYEPSLTLDAQETWNQRRGDCLSYAHLFNSLARYLQVPVNYVRYRAAVSAEEQGGHLLIVSHVASYFSDGQSSVVVELSGRAPSFWSADYQVIDDQEAWTLHYTNEAVQLLSRGETDLAEKKLRFLLEHGPAVAEVPINLSALLLRTNRAHEAYALTQSALIRFVDSVALLFNAAAAATALGKAAEGQTFLARARSPLVDPFSTLLQGIGHLKQGDIVKAEQLFSRAHAKAPEAIVIAAWKARAQSMLGRNREAVATLRQMRARDPKHPLVGAVEAELARVLQQSSGRQVDEWNSGALEGIQPAAP
jgi:tetratricopeptide (TPR) repeat protein